jgi:hypothetical protein
MIYMGERKVHTGFWWGNLKERVNMGRPRQNWNNNNNRTCVEERKSIGGGGSSCKEGNEHLGSIKYESFLTNSGKISFSSSLLHVVSE